MKYFCFDFEIEGESFYWKVIHTLGPKNTFLTWVNVKLGKFESAGDNCTEFCVIVNALDFDKKIPR